MRYDEEEVDPHQLEMPDTRCVVPSEELCQPMQLHGLVNRPSCRDRNETGDRNGEIRCALERVVLCVKARMQPLAACQFGEGKPQVVSKHPERVTRSVRRGSKERQAPPMTSPATYTMPFSMNRYAHDQCRRRASANMPGPRLMWL